MRVRHSCGNLLLGEEGGRRAGAGGIAVSAEELVAGKKHEARADKQRLGRSKESRRRPYPLDGLRARGAHPPSLQRDAVTRTLMRARRKNGEVIEGKRLVVVVFKLETDACCAIQEGEEEDRPWFTGVRHDAKILFDSLIFN
jgi:hypothetical protein